MSVYIFIFMCVCVQRKELAVWKGRVQEGGKAAPRIDPSGPPEEGEGSEGGSSVDSEEEEESLVDSDEEEEEEEEEESVLSEDEEEYVPGDTPYKRGGGGRRRRAGAGDVSNSNGSSSRPVGRARTWRTSLSGRGRDRGGSRADDPTHTWSTSSSRDGRDSTGSSSSRDSADGERESSDPIPNPAAVGKEAGSRKRKPLTDITNAPPGAAPTAAAAEYTRDSLSGCTVAGLKDICRGMGLPVSGRKDELMERIISHTSVSDCAKEEVEVGVSEGAGGVSDPLVSSTAIPQYSELESHVVTSTNGAAVDTHKKRRLVSNVAMDYDMLLQNDV